MRNLAKAAYRGFVEGRNHHRRMGERLPPYTDSSLERVADDIAGVIHDDVGEKFNLSSRQETRLAREVGRAISMFDPEEPRLRDPLVHSTIRGIALDLHLQR